MYLLVFCYVLLAIFMGLSINTIILIDRYHTKYYESIIYNGYYESEKYMNELFIKYQSSKLLLYIIIMTVLLLLIKYEYYITNNIYLI
jgi:hypothetical protein